MEIRIVRLGIAALLGAGLLSCPGSCQSDAAPPAAVPRSEYQIYFSFFHRVQYPAYRSSRAPADSVHFSSKPMSPDDVPVFPQLAGLTDREINDVRAIAADCEQRLQAVGSDHPHLAWEAVMESIETGEDQSTKVEQMVRADQDQRERIVLAHEQVLKAALGDARFQELDARLREASNRTPLVLPVTRKQ